MQQLEDIGAPENVDSWLDKQMSDDRRIMGFGHRVYKTEDPRATVLRRLASEACLRNGDGHWHEIAARLEKRVLEQQENNRLIRPRARYCGPGMRTWSNLTERAPG